MNRGSPPPVRRLLCETLAVGLAWCLLPLLRMPGLALHPASRIWGSAVTDTASQPWTLWHVAWHLRHEVRLGLETQLAAAGAQIEERAA